jgi:hypothetical protein
VTVTVCTGLLDHGGVSIGFAHCVAAMPAVLAKACKTVTAMIADSTSNEGVIFFLS